MSSSSNDTDEQTPIKPKLKANLDFGDLNEGKIMEIVNLVRLYQDLE